MIVPLTGNVKFPITLDPTVWIFDDRIMKFEDAFSEDNKVETKEEDYSFTSDERFNREVFQATNDNKPIPKKEAEELLKSTLVIAFAPFYEKAEVNEDAEKAVLVQENGDEVIISTKQLEESYFLFAYEGKQPEDGPVHIYFRDGSNKEDPIKNVKKIVIK